MKQPPARRGDAAAIDAWLRVRAPTIVEPEQLPPPAPIPGEEPRTIRGDVARKLRAFAIAKDSPLAEIAQACARMLGEPQPDNDADREKLIREHWNRACKAQPRFEYKPSKLRGRRARPSQNPYATSRAH